MSQLPSFAAPWRSLKAHNLASRQA